MSSTRLFSSVATTSAASLSAAICTGFTVMKSPTGRSAMALSFWKARTKSPCVKTPASVPSAFVTTAAPLRARVIACRASRTVVVGETTAICAPLRITSRTRVSSACPIAPPGCSLAKSSVRKPRASSSTIASASQSTSMTVVLDVGARFSGQASCVTCVSSTTSAFLAKVEPKTPVSAMMGICCRLR